jgi:hypothetical protein
LAYFCSNSNENISFSRYFSQTRTRLYLAAYANYGNKTTSVHNLYMLACVEENHHQRIRDCGFKPTHYRERFIHEPLKNRNKGTLKDMRKLVDFWKIVEADFDPNSARHWKLAEIGPALVEFFKTVHVVRG